VVALEHVARRHEVLAEVGDELGIRHRDDQAAGATRRTSARKARGHRRAPSTSMHIAASGVVGKGQSVAVDLLERQALAREFAQSASFISAPTQSYPSGRSWRP